MKGAKHPSHSDPPPKKVGRLSVTREKFRKKISINSTKFTDFSDIKCLTPISGGGL